MDAYPIWGREPYPALFSIRGMPSVPDGDGDAKHDGLLPSFKRVLPMCAGFCAHKTSKMGHPLLIERLGRYDCKAMGNHLDDMMVRRLDGCTHWCNRNTICM